MRWALVLVAACGSDPIDRPIDATTTDGIVDSGAPNLSYISLAPGWKVDVFRDVTPLIPYIDMQFIDGTEIYSNEISRPFVTQGLQGDALGICVGREIAILTPSSFGLHDYGKHAPNTPGLPDGISSGVWTNDTIVLSSSSLNSGDGLFALASDWSIMQRLVDNNTRVVALDPSGAFDAKGTPQLYYGNIAGVYRVAAPPVQIRFANDASSLAINGMTMLYTDRLSDTSADLYTIAQTTHTQTLLAHSTEILLGEGPPRSATGLGWAIVDGGKVVEVDMAAAGNLSHVAQTNDPLYVWTGVTVPVSTHPLGQNFPSVYVTEHNRTLNQERVLRFTRQ